MAIPIIGAKRFAVTITGMVPPGTPDANAMVAIVNAISCSVALASYVEGTAFAFLDADGKPIPDPN